MMRPARWMDIGQAKSEESSRGRAEQPPVAGEERRGDGVAVWHHQRPREPIKGPQHGPERGPGCMANRKSSQPQSLTRLICKMGRMPFLNGQSHVAPTVLTTPLCTPRRER